MGHNFTPEERERGWRASVAARARYAQERRMAAAQAVASGVGVGELVALMVDVALSGRVSAADLRRVRALGDAIGELRAQERRGGAASSSSAGLRRLLGT